MLALNMLGSAGMGMFSIQARLWRPLRVVATWFVRVMRRSFVVRQVCKDMPWLLGCEAVGLIENRLSLYQKKPAGGSSSSR
jgi:hypothetical protein